MGENILRRERVWPKMDKKLRSQDYEEQERLTDFQELLLEARVDYEKKRKRVVRDYEFARWLGVSVNSYSGWMNGIRTPGYNNAIQLSRRLGQRVFDVLGFSRISVAFLPGIKFIVDRWEKLDAETKKQIIEHIAEETGELPPELPDEF